MKFDEMLVVGILVLCAFITLTSVMYYQSRNELIAKSKVPMTTACALDADVSHTTPACTIYLTRTKL